jgi:hypothetical protein
VPDEGQSLLALAEQRGKQATASLNRVCSAFTQLVKVIVGRDISIHAALPADESGQLPDLGSTSPPAKPRC